MKDLIGGAIEDLSMVASLSTDSQFIGELKDVVAFGFDEVWASKGALIGANWDGHDLVKTGRLRASMTEPYLLDLKIVGDLFIFSSNVPYSGYVDERYKFSEIPSSIIVDILRLVQIYLNKYGNLDWT